MCGQRYLILGSGEYVLLQGHKIQLEADRTQDVSRSPLEKVQAEQSTQYNQNGAKLFCSSIPKP